MRWLTAWALVLLLFAAPMGVQADQGRAAPSCLTQDGASLPPTIDIDPDVCVIVDLGVLQPGDVYEMSIIVVNDAIDLLFVDEKTQLNFFYMLEVGAFAYAGMVHFPIVILNNVIIFKEIVIEFIHLAISRHGRNNDDNIALGLYDFYVFWSTVFEVINPLTYLKFVRKELY